MPEHIFGLADVVAARRDVRRYRPDAVPDDILTAVLEAGHRAPSVGHSQPWRFIVVREPGTRDAAAAMADRARIKQAAQMDEASARGLLDLQLEGIREAPVGIVVACDRRTPAAGVLGRATFPDADLWSCATAIQNMWLTARVYGLGMGWVTLFEPAELAALLGLPDGVETLGWLCLGWPDERPPEPGLQRAGWSKRQPLADVVMHERWEADATPPPSHLAGDRFAAPNQDRVVAARDRADELLTPPGSLGVLDRVLDRLTALPGPLESGTLVVAAADHAVTDHGVSAFDTTVTRDVFAATTRGESMGAVAARSAGLELITIDAGVGVRRGNITAADALDRDELTRLVADGKAAGSRAGRHGIVALGEIGIGNTTVAAALTAALLGRSPDDVVGRGASADAAMLDRKRDVVAQALARLTTRAPDDVLRTVGGAEFAVLTGVVLGACEAGAGVVLDGLATSVCALIAARLEPGVVAHLVAGQRSRESAHSDVLAELGLEPLLDLRIRSGEGVGAALACGLLLDGLAIRRGVARTH
ncbi:5,6-dimethylbenzimidazole synthase [Epidermidibacterium keratini]|uniref:Nicotinate-nucleotide--dimethylbenzimidazole phosphoribosyltransferase n=2 Tax=Epidermidibacterium keratini TaxID=1891644 RepID=A0A7L4YUH6_9ACTN|nr:5,6-dimethylbenzimidazole synthase [Epidermidibacterium keratini]